MKQEPCTSKRALVIFADKSDLKWLWPLKRGFRHCFAIIEGQAGWVAYNPLSHYTDIEIYPFYQAREISEFYQGLGYTVITARVLQPPKRLAPVAIYTCVEAVKRALGIHGRSIVTPWQLFQHLDKNLKIEK